MAETTGIAWTDSTFNPWIGCTKVGPGCDHCYAEAQDSRKRWGDTTHWGPGTPRHRTSAGNWRHPRIWNHNAGVRNEVRRVFCASLADVFDNEIPEAWRADLWALIRETPNLTWQIVTKRIGNARKMLPTDWGRGYPNVWIISTIVNQEEWDRDADKLFGTPAHIHGVSYEPALSGIDWGNVIPDWIIIGGESRQGSFEPRPFHLAWADDTIRQCRSRDSAPFVKQLGSVWAEHHNMHSEIRSDRAGSNMEAWPEWARIREFPQRHRV